MSTLRIEGQAGDRAIWMNDTTTPSQAALVAATSRSEGQSSVALRASLTLMVPVARWLMRNGVQYGTFATALKQVFVKVAQEELQATGGKLTDSALSVLSGVHRKDVRALGGRAHGTLASKPPSPVSQLFARWMSDARFHDAAGRPRALPRLGAEGSFEALAREVSTDVHPRTLLDELLRLGVARMDNDKVELLANPFVPSADMEGLADLLAASGADHLAAAVHNLTSREPRFLEQSVFTEGLSEHSAEELGAIARELWAVAFQRMVAESGARWEADHKDAAKVGEPYRIRFGVYFYTEPESGSGQDSGRT